jgi:hypothetical protein
MTMDAGKARKLMASNWSSVLISVLCVLLLVSVVWNFRQYRLAEVRRLQVVAMERDMSERAARAQVQVTKARSKRKAAATDVRVDQLYREIENLSRISEQIMLRSHRPPELLTEKGSGGAAEAP